MNQSNQNIPLGFIDEQAKREIRRAILKAIAIPGYQAPYSSREMPMARGFGTGGLQLTLSLVGRDDVVKVIDQGSDDSVNAVNIRKFIQGVCGGVSTTLRTRNATLIQTRHRIPEAPLREDQILVFQVPYPDSLVIVESNEATRKRMHGEGDYSRLLVKLYEDMVHFKKVTISHRYPTQIHTHYVIDPSPIPRYDVSRLDQAPNLFLFGAGREKKIYAVPPYTEAKPLILDDVPFEVEDFNNPQTGKRLSCAICGCVHSFLEEFKRSDGISVWQCSDTDHCASVLEGLETRGGLA